MSLFYSNPTTSIEKTYQDLVNDVNGIKKLNRALEPDSTYDLFVSIIAGLLSNFRHVIFDIDFSETEKEQIRNESPIPDKQKLTHFSIANAEQLINELIQNKDSEITLFTSGTTGLPKMVSHSLSSITRFTRISEKYKHNIWALAYNPTHIAGLQVFIQALFNKNPIYDIFLTAKKEITKMITENHITHISATPTFYRMLLPYNSPYTHVQSATIGGEKTTGALLDQLRNMFPKAKLHNIYASTEAGSILKSDGESFKILPEFLDMYLIRDNELMLHKDFVGRSDHIELEDGIWYRTGDIVRILSEDPMEFAFLHRKNEMINVGGNKVNPVEVEEAIMKIPGIVSARVYGKPNSVVGNIVCAEIVREEEITENDIRQELNTTLQNFKHPRLIQFTDKLLITRTGKIQR